MPSSLFRLCRNNPATTSSTSESPAWTTTSPRCSTIDPIRRGSRAAPQCIRWLRLRCNPCRRHAEQNARQQRQSACERQDRRATGWCGSGMFSAPGKRQRQQHPRSRIGHASPDDTAHSGQHDALRQQLPNDSSPRMAPSAARTLISALPCHATHQQQIRNVRARNQQHQPGNTPSATCSC